MKKRNLTFITAVILICSVSLSAQQPTLTPDLRTVLDRISGDSLRGHLSFIASDALEGRNTPSRGLDIAAEYIASQFRRAGLEPAGDDGYFQTAHFLTTERDMAAFKLEIRDGNETISVPNSQVSFSIEGALSLKRAPLFKIDFKDSAALAALKPEQMDGQIVIAEMPDIRRVEPSLRGEVFRNQNAFISRLTDFKTALILSIDRANPSGSGAASRLIDPDNRRPALASPVAVITVHDPRAVKLYDSMKPGPASADVSLQLDAAIEKPAKLRNVIGLLRGSDAALRDSFVLVTAHYDHLGTRPGMPGDNIFNGANDDGSGTVSVIELASALSTLKPHPKRSVVFITFFGEEKGLLGSRYYGRHPVFPIEKTVADVNLEQVGRTDSSEGPQISNATLTGFDYSDLGPIFQQAGELTGVRVYKHEQNSDAFFSRSDNQALADQGVPAHTLCTAFVYPDYHGAGDHWDKIDYANMERVDRMVGLALIIIANNPSAPKWNEANPKAARYVKAWNDHHGK